MIEVSKWLQANFLTLNTNTTKSMLFGTQAKLRRIEESLHVKTGDNTIDNVDHFKYVCVWLD